MAVRTTTTEAPSQSVRVLFEDGLANWLSRSGPFIAIGAKKDMLPALGAARTYTDDSVWRDKAIEWLERARCIVLMLGRGSGLDWEIRQIWSLGYWRKTICIFPPFSKPARRRHRNRCGKIWRAFLSRIDDGRLKAELAAIKPDRVMAFWMRANGSATVLKCSHPFLQDYELAVRLALVEQATLDRLEAPPRGLPPTSGDSVNETSQPAI